MYTQGVTMEELATMEALRQGASALAEISKTLEEMTKTLKDINKTLEAYKNNDV